VCITGTFTESVQQIYVSLHNQVRNSVNANLPPMTWSPTLASFSSLQVSSCVFGDGNGPYGVNTFATALQPPTEEEVTGGWGSEAAFYNYADNSCEAGKDCLHYTQMVWRDTVEVGCAMTRCETNSPWGNRYPVWYFVVCNYNPPGNVVGVRPY